MPFTRSIPQPTPDETDRFWSRVDRSEGPDACWIYGANSITHPLIYYRGHYLQGTSYPAHRIAYTIVKGPIPEGLSLDHTCDVKACVNPNHLEPVTHRENIVRGVERRLTWDIYVNWIWYSGGPVAKLSAERIKHLIEEGEIRTRKWWGQTFLNREDVMSKG